MKDSDPHQTRVLVPESTTDAEHLEPTGHINPLLVQPPRKPVIGAVPESALLKRLHDFLPQIAAANASLPTEATPEDPYLPSLHPRDDADQPTICPPNHGGLAADSDDSSDDSSDEHSDAEGPRIEMDLACGVFELHDASATDAAARAAGGVGTLGQESTEGNEAGEALQSPAALLRAVQGRAEADLREVPHHAPDDKTADT